MLQTEKKKKKEYYSRPVINTTPTPTFRTNGICSPITALTGKPNKKTSVATPTAETGIERLNPFRVDEPRLWVAHVWERVGVLRTNKAMLTAP